MKKHTGILMLAAISLLISSSCKKENSKDPDAPHACFVVPNEISAGQPAAFNSSCSENASSFSWSFGDGGTSSDVNPVHSFNEAGSFDVVLTVRDVAGASDQMSITVIVMAPEFIEHSGNITSDETWIEGVHFINGDVHVDGAILTIEPGAIINFKSGAALYIGYHSGHSGATLIANGTSEKMITFTSAAATKSAGDWDYIWFDAGASKISSMQFCTLEYGGGYSDNYGAIHIAGSAVSIENSAIKLSDAHGISLDNEGYFTSFSGNLLEQNRLSAISIYGNYVHTIGEDNTLVSDEGIIVRADNLEVASVTWLKQTAAYVIEGDLYVGSTSGTSLTLAPGVEIRMGSGSAIYFAYRSGTFGTLTALGTAEDRIRITSNAPAVSKSAGDWDYLWFDKGAGTKSAFDFCDIEYGGGYSNNYGMIHVKESGISVTNSSIRYSESQGISMNEEGMFTECSDNLFEDNAAYPIELHGNFAHTVGRGNLFNTGPGILVKGDRIDQAEIKWLKQAVPYVVDGYLDLGGNSGSKLVIEPGTTVNFTSSSIIRVGYFTGTYGILEADGEPDNMITFSSSAPAGFGSPGDWDGIWFFNGTTSGNILDYCIISYGGGYGSSSGNLNFQNETVGVPVISNCQINNSAAFGFYLNVNANPTLNDNTFENNAKGDSNL